MRTNIEIDDALLADAMAATGEKTKRGAAEAASRQVARKHRQRGALKELGESAGKATWTPCARGGRSSRSA
jgi:Arc/MetJ family transcription regulator